jgi:hypothetical protein
MQSIESGGDGRCCSFTDTTCCCFDNNKNQLTFKDPRVKMLRSKRIVGLMIIAITGEDAKYP